VELLASNKNIHHVNICKICKILYTKVLALPLSVIYFIVSFLRAEFLDSVSSLRLILKKFRRRVDCFIETQVSIFLDVYIHLRNWYLFLSFCYHLLVDEVIRILGPIILPSFGPCCTSNR
jgi:hypothetical protein